MLRRREYDGTVAYMGMGGIWSLPAAWVSSWTAMLQYNQEHLSRPVHYARAGTTYHSYARNDIVNRMRGDWLLMLDCDHEFEPDLCARLLNTMRRLDLDVLTGFYQYRTPPHAPTIYHWKQGGDGVNPIGGWNEEYPVIQVDAAGAGCLMVRRRVFDRIREEIRGEQPFDVRPPYSEDLSFFRRLADLGIKAFCDTRVHYWHLDRRRIDRDDFQIDLCRKLPEQEIVAYG